MRDAPTFHRTLRSLRRAIVGYAIALVLLVALMAAVWPTVASQADTFRTVVESYPPALRAAFAIDDIFTGPGFLKAELFSAMVPILLLVLAIGKGSDLVAGEEERGALEVPLASGARRGRLVLEKAAGLGMALAGLVAILLLAIVVADAIVGFGVSMGGLLSMGLQLALLAGVGGGLAVALGAHFGRKAIAVAGATAFMASSYLLDVASRLADGASWLRFASVFHHYLGEDPLVNGLDVPGAAVLLALLGSTVAAAAWAFERRDIGV